ncbi:phage/plasmid primase, P4 family [Clostridium sp. WILCCON 0269]|uniref:Phage/plasmid primase, P4 family n=1 Tax=Candidatus Clostridium eludens TaxID=3381663 RepID=A0ABW8SQR8_9CLOT
MEELKSIIELETGLKFDRNNSICCPFHQEKTPSFKIYGKDGKQKFKCFGCGENGDVIDFLVKYKNFDYIKAVKYLNDKGFNFELKDIEYMDIIGFIKWQLEHIREMKDFKFIEKYEYRNLKNEIKYYKVKFKTGEGKQCRYYSIIDDKVKCRRKGEELPYNLYKLARSKSDIIFVAEGEKDADSLIKLGLIATSLKGFKYDKYICRLFKNKNIIIIPDNDLPGQRYQNEVINGLRPYIKSFKIFPIQEYAKESGQDITDLLNLKYLDKQTFMDVIRETGPTNTYISGSKLITVKLARLILKCEDIIFTQNEGFFHYETGYYKLLNELEMKALVSGYLEDRFNTSRIKNEILGHIMETVIKEVKVDNQYLNFKNCLLKITKDGIEMLEHTPEIITINQFNYDFKKVEYKKSSYYEGLQYALYDDEEIVEFLQQFAGACLMPNAHKMKAALIVVGGKGTAKSSFIEPLQAMMGDLYSSYDLKTIEEDRFALAYLVTKKCILNTEDSGKKLETCGRLKRLIFGESITSDKKNKDPVLLNLNLAVIMALNDIPKINDKSNAIFDRLHFVKFKRKIRGTAKDDPLFVDKIIQNEMPEVINFALDGLLKLLRNDYVLQIPNEVQFIKTSVIADNSYFENWLLNCTEPSPNEFDTLKNLYDSYIGYCIYELGIDEREAKHECGKIDANRLLQERGFQYKNQFKKNNSKFKNIFLGIKLNETGENCLSKVPKA